MPPKAKRKKVIWNNNDCNADVCKRPELTSTWVKCDACKKWYHMVCVEVLEDQLPDKKDWYCPKCHIVKSQEYDIVKEMLFAKVSDLASSQPDFSSITISRDMFKFKKNAGTFNFATEFPPTLQELNKRIKSKFSTLADFRFEYKLMCKKLIEELMSNYASQVQFIEFELDDIFEEITNPAEPEPEPEPEPELEPEYDIQPEMSPGSMNNPEPQAFGIAGGGLIRIKQERSNVIDLGVSSLNSSMEYSGDEDDLTWEFSSQDDHHDEEMDVHQCPEKLSCTHCSKRFTDAGIYSCKRDHKICANCRMMIPGCVCPVCHQENGDRKRLALDHGANAMHRLVGVGAKSSSERIKISMAKAIKGKGGRTRTPKLVDSGFSSEDGSQAALTSNVRPPKRKSCQQDEEEGTDADSGFGIGMVWSCQDASVDSKAGLLTSGQIKKEKFAEPQYSSEQETPSIDMTAMVSDTQATTMLTMIHADVVHAETSSAYEMPCSNSPASTMSSLSSPTGNMSSLVLAAEQVFSSTSSDVEPSARAGAAKGKPKQAPKRGRISDKVVKMNISEMNKLDSDNRTSDDQIELINGQIHLRVREMSKTQKHIAKLKDPKYKEFYADKVKEMRLEIKHLSQLLTEHIKDGDIESPVKKVNRAPHSNIAAKNKSVITKSVKSPSQSLPSRSGAAAALQLSSFYTDKLAATSSTFSAAKQPTTFMKPLIIRPRQASESPRGSLDNPLPPVNRPRHPSAESIFPDHHQAYPPMSLERSSISADSPLKPVIPSSSSNLITVKQERFADEHSLGQSSFQILQVQSMADQPDNNLLLPDNNNQMGQFICQSSFIPDTNSLPSDNTPLNTVPVDNHPHNKMVEANQAPYGQIDQSNDINQANYVDMSTAEDGMQMSMVSMDNNFVDMSCISIGDLVCSDSVVVDQEALIQDVHGSDFVPVEGGEGKENEGVEEEGDGGCYDIIDWKNNKHISEGDFSMSKVGDLNGSAPRWVPLITVCSQTAQGLYFFEICRIDSVYQLRAYAEFPNTRDKWIIHLNGNIVLVLGGKFTSKSACQPKQLAQSFSPSDTLHFQVTITC